MRKFYLESRTGERLNLQKKPLFFHKPDGLGYTDTRDYFESEYGFYFETNKTYEQPEITGDWVISSGDRYREYSDLVQWLYMAEPVKLVYIPEPGMDELYMDIDIEHVGKSEKTLYGTLELPVSIKGKTPYCFRNPLIFTFTNEVISSPKQYPYQYDYQYAQTASGDVVEFTPRGHFPAAFDLTANGPISNPVLRAHGKSNGVVYGVLDLTGVVIAQGERLLWSSRQNNEHVIKTNGSIKTDLINDIDLSNNNFFTVPAGVLVELTFNADIDPAFTENLEHPLALYEYLKG